MPDEAQRLIGRWELMATAEIDEIEDELNPELARTLRRDTVRIDRTVLGDDIMRLEFSAGGQLQTYAKQPKQGTWSFSAWDRDTDTVTIRCQIGEDPPITTEIQFLRDDIIYLVPPNLDVLGQAFVFRRQGEQLD